MAQTELEGITLGQKRRSYNKLANAYVRSNKMINVSSDLNSGENDVEHLINIDVACKNRNEEYVLKVLKCDDMLYVSRAVKLSKWLVTDRQYSHIINPHYLHNELLPQMMTKAGIKLMLHIRLHLRDEIRVEEFYNYYKPKNISIALKWLPHCSLQLIEKEVQEQHDLITKDLLKRLCEKSVSVLDKHMQIFGDCIYNKLKVTKFLINEYPEKYLDILETCSSSYVPPFGRKYTDKIMRSCPQRIIDKFDFYAGKIDIESFTKRLKIMGKINEFLATNIHKIKQFHNNRLVSWFTFDKLRFFIKQMPEEDKFDYVKKFYIDKNYVVITPTSSNTGYCWYSFAPFDIAFPELTKLIQVELSPIERVAMLAVLITCANRNQSHFNQLFKYYIQEHINESFKFKIQFTNLLLSKSDYYNFEVTTWNLLNCIFYSMDVYSESKNDDQTCLQAIIIYHTIHDLKIPDIVSKKFNFNTLCFIRNKLNEKESSKVFNHLYQNLIFKLNNKIITTETDFIETIALLENLQCLLKDWKKNFSDFPWIHDKIKNLLLIRNTNRTWQSDLSFLYKKHKPWRRCMIEESLDLAPSEETCYNALKHYPVILNKSKMEELCRDDNISLQRVLQKLRVYWPQSLALHWKNMYLENLDLSGRHRATIRGLCVLMSPKEIIKVVEKYAPDNAMINWGKEDEKLLNLRRQVAMNMHLTRTLLPVEFPFLYAQGDYLPYALSSINAIMYNKNACSVYENIKVLLTAHESLKKLGILLAISKLKSETVKDLYFGLWKSHQNSSIRGLLFKQTFNLLCKEKSLIHLKEIWELMSILIQDLSTREKKTTYEILVNVSEVPDTVRGSYIVKAYNLLKSLPPECKCEDLAVNVLTSMIFNMEYLDSSFVEELLLNALNTYLINNVHLSSNFSPLLDVGIDVGLPKKPTFNNVHFHLMVIYVLCTHDKDTQAYRFKKILLPLFKISFEHWDEKFEEYDSFGTNVIKVLELLSSYFQMLVFEKNMVFPTKLFLEIQNLMDLNLVTDTNYKTLRAWKIKATYVNLLAKEKACLETISFSKKTSIHEQLDYYYPESLNTWNEIYKKALPELSQFVSSFLNEDIEKYFSSIHLLFAEALKEAFKCINKEILFHFLDTLLENRPRVEMYLIAIEILPAVYYPKDDVAIIIQNIRNKLISNPSLEVKLHYCRKFGNHDS